MKIIAQQIERSKSQQVRADLNSILTRWKYGNQPFKNSTDFINRMTPWINDKIKEEKELAEFLKRKKVKNLSEIE